ncbi:phage holin family protein [Streptomyces atriruber]|uniref:phage holin family protein n=1 Tax=Streptomyces atriruber TaxID=545121 RepID=UPI0006E33ABB|nr:phage holin family protein [Streptomyces atriruber]
MTGPENALSGLDRGLTDELVRTIRAELREELREQTRKQRRKATLYAASGAAAFYAGAAAALAIGLVIALGLPGWAAALIVGALLGGAAVLLRNAAEQGPARDTGAPGAGALPEPTGSGLAAPAVPDAAPDVRPGGLGTPEAPPMPPTAPPTGRADVPGPRR